MTMFVHVQRLTIVRHVRVVRTSVISVTNQSDLNQRMTAYLHGLSNIQKNFGERLQMISYGIKNGIKCWTILTLLLQDGKDNFHFF